MRIFVKTLTDKTLDVEASDTIDKMESNKKVLQNEISDSETSTHDAKESITTLKAETTEELVISEETLKNKQIDLMVGLHADCDWLLKYDDALELFEKHHPS